MTDNSRVLKDDFQIKHKGTLGLFAPDPNQGGDHPGPAFGEITWLGKADKFRLTRRGDDKFEGFWPKKAREHPRGKVNFPLRMIPWLSPDAKHPGWRLRRRARSTTAPSQTSAFLPASVGTKQMLQNKQYPRLRSRRFHLLVQGYRGLNKPPASSLFFTLHNMTVRRKIV